MIIDEFFRDEQNEIWVICGDQKIHLTAQYVATHKPQVGDEVVAEEPVVEASAEAPVEAEAPAEAPVEQ
jgi:hypothetical protein